MALDKGLQEIRDKLVNRRNELLERISQTNEVARGATDFEGDDYDKAISAEDREMTFSLSSMDREEILAIDSAIKKMNSNQYGECEECGDKILKKRLKILPFTKYCRDCQSEIEEEAKVRGR